jgi:regulator of protease activity HflC (stomatin/prohibitin superfamily)
LFIIKETERGALYENGALKEVLGPGRCKYRYWPWTTVRREVVIVDIRSRSLTIKGQQILTADKVAVQLSILVNFRVTDVKAALHNVESYEDRIYEDVQLSTRRLLAVKTLDAILKDRNDICDAVRQDVREAAASYGVEITRADVKDLVFPGNLREIMNRVLETERQSEAMLIEARKKAEAQMILAQADREAQSARLATDRALAEQLAAHPVLLRVRELETLQRIAEKPGHHFYIGLGETFSALAAHSTERNG